MKYDFISSFLKNKKYKFISIFFIIIVILFSGYSLIWNTKYPVSNWKTYTNSNYGLSFRYPSNVQAIEAYDGSFIHVTADLTHPEIFMAPEDLAYQSKEYSCPGASGVCVDKVLRGFLLRISVNSPDPCISSNCEQYIKTHPNEYRDFTIDGIRGTKKVNLGLVFPYLQKDVNVSVVKSNKRFNLSGYFPVNEKMYGRLYDQIISTVRLDQ